MIALPALYHIRHRLKRTTAQSVIKYRIHDLHFIQEIIEPLIFLRTLHTAVGSAVYNDRALFIDDFSASEQAASFNRNLYSDSMLHLFPPPGSVLIFNLILHPEPLDKDDLYLVKALFPLYACIKSQEVSDKSDRKLLRTNHFCLSQILEFFLILMNKNRPKNGIRNGVDPDSDGK